MADCFQTKATVLENFDLDRTQGALAIADYAVRVWCQFWIVYLSIKSGQYLLGLLASWSTSFTDKGDLVEHQVRSRGYSIAIVNISHHDPLSNNSMNLPSNGCYSPVLLFQAISKSMLCSTVSSTYAYLSSQNVTRLQYEIIKAILLDNKIWNSDF